MGLTVLPTCGWIHTQNIQGVSIRRWIDDKVGVLQASKRVDQGQRKKKNKHMFSRKQDKNNNSDCRISIVMTMIIAIL